MKISIRERRKAAGLVQGEVAKALDVSTAQYSRYERDPSSMKIDKLRALADFFGCSVDDLVGDDGEGIELSPFSTVRRTVAVYSQAKSDWRGGVLIKVGEFSPTKEVSSEAYAIQVDTDDMVANDWKSLPPGSWLVVDPKVQPSPGDTVHAIDEATDDNVIRIYQPLHPSNPRAPGFLLKAANPALDDIYVSADDAPKVLLGTVIEARVVFKK